MDELQHIITNLMDMLDKSHQEAESLASSMQQLQTCLDEQLKTIVHGNLDRLLNQVKEEVARITQRNISELSALVLISPEGKATVDEVYGDLNSELRKMKSQGFLVITLVEFSSLIQSLKSRVTGGDWVPVMEFLRVNAEPAPLPEYWLPLTTKEISQPSQTSTSSAWRLSDFLPAAFPHPPLPRGLFKD